jgi:hypothetical protein
VGPAGVCPFIGVRPSSRGWSLERELLFELLDRDDADVERGTKRAGKRPRLGHADEVGRDAGVDVPRVRIAEAGEGAALRDDEHDDDGRLAVVLRRALERPRADLREALAVREVEEALGGDHLLPLDDLAVAVLDLDRLDELGSGVCAPVVAAHGEPPSDVGGKNASVGARFHGTGGVGGAGMGPAGPPRADNPVR